jgi:hypothetical protein
LIHFKSNYFLKSSTIFLATITLILTKNIIINYGPLELIKIIDLIYLFIYIILICISSFNLLFLSMDKFDLNNQIEDLEKEKDYAKVFNKPFIYEKLIEDYLNLYEEIWIGPKFVHILKSKVELTQYENFGNYCLVFLIFFSAQHSFNSFFPIGPIIYISFVLVYILFSIRLLIWEFIRIKKLDSIIIIGQSIAILLFFSWGKNSYVRNFGDEIIGSFLEKPEYTTQYYINLFSDDNLIKKYHLPAEVQVTTDLDYEETGEGNTVSIETKYVIIKKVFLPDGSYLKFDNCKTDLTYRLIGSDQNGREWEIQLTNEKVN